MSRFLCIICTRERESEREREREREGETDRQTDRQTDRETERDRERQTDTERELMLSCAIINLFECLSLEFVSFSKGSENES